MQVRCRAFNAHIISKKHFLGEIDDFRFVCEECNLEIKTNIWTNRNSTAVKWVSLGLGLVAEVWCRFDVGSSVPASDVVGVTLEAGLHRFIIFLLGIGLGNW
jgi:hypothetical protein